MIEFVNYPPQQPGDVVWSEDGRRQIERRAWLFSYVQLGADQRSHIYDDAECVVDALAKVVRDNVPDKDPVVATEIMRALLDDAGVGEPYAPTRMKTVYGALQNEEAYQKAKTEGLAV